jgi:hypothetical protein
MTPRDVVTLGVRQFPQLRTSTTGAKTYPHLTLLIVGTDLTELRALESDFTNQEVFDCRVTACPSIDEAIDKARRTQFTSALIATAPDIVKTAAALLSVGANVIALLDRGSAEQRQALIALGCTDIVDKATLNENAIEWMLLCALQWHRSRCLASSR